MGVESRYGLKFGYMDHGPRNLITDVPGVRVGHVTIHDGEVHTGVTAIIPHTGDVFHEKCLAGAHVINGFGKSIGLVQVQELGTLESPILLTNTLSVGTVSTALVEYMLERNDDIGLDAGTVNSLVMECNDARLSDIRGLHITKEHARAALAAASETFAEGDVGAGAGMVCYSLKGGIGSASRLCHLYGETYTVGALVMTNFGTLRDLKVAGDSVGERLFWQEQSFLEDIKEKYDVCYQMNCGFALERRLSASLLARRLIQNQIVDIWATDAHNLTTRPPKMAEAFQFFTERKNIKALKMFVTEDQLD